MRANSSLCHARMSSWYTECWPRNTARNFAVVPSPERTRAQASAQARRYHPPGWSPVGRPCRDLAPAIAFGLVLISGNSLTISSIMCCMHPSIGGGVSRWTWLAFTSWLAFVWVLSPSNKSELRSTRARTARFAVLPPASTCIFPVRLIRLRLARL